MKLLIHGLCAIILAAILSGCSHQVVPPLVRVDAGKLPELRGNRSVSLTAVRNPDAEEIKLLGTGLHSYHTRLDLLSEAALVSLEDILAKKNITVSGNSDRKLRITVVYADIIHQYPGFLCIVKLQARAGENLVEEFTGLNYFMRLSRIGENVSEAINHALLDMLRNERFAAYLGG